MPASAAVSAPAAYTYADERRNAETAVANAHAAIAKGPVVWTQWKTLAEAELAEAQLTGNYAGYTSAAISLDQAFALAATNQGPYLSRARYNFTVHRLGLVEADLARAETEGDPERTAILGLRSDVAFYRGHYAEAMDGYRAALARREDVTALVRLALGHARMGHTSEAAALLDRAEGIYHGDSPLPRAWLALQHGLLELDRGRWQLALAHYEHALRLLPGWWLAREHIAEIHALQGDTHGALREYEQIISETNNPEYMDAVAKILHSHGDEAAAAPWIARARALYETRLATLPEATYGHGLDHFQLFGTPAESLALARKNYALRPNGESAIKLSNALLRANTPGEAASLMRATLASGWNTAELHAAASHAFDAVGRHQQAMEQITLAKAMNPHAQMQYGLPAAAQQTVAALR